MGLKKRCLIWLWSLISLWPIVFATAAPLKISAQLHSVKDELSRDFDKTLSELAKMGFSGVEFAGRYGPYVNNPDGLKKRLAELQLKVSGVHVPLQQLRGDAGARNLRFYQRIGAETVIIPHDIRVNDPNKIDELINELNKISSIAQGYGLKLGYHNHAKEFDTYLSGSYWDYLNTHTDNAVVMQLDVGWARFAKQDPVQLLTQHPNRTLTTHFKIRTYKGRPGSVAAETKVLLGEDNYDWHALIQACKTKGATQWIVIEQEEYPQGLTPLQSIERSLNGIAPFLVGN
ncbi:sugar phosphate isomerase/epimerase [Thalassotalea litorea]|uniref:Sugar phosphate isomerase/epimerase n=1 Tax=Thalassotalea litorea TaxID=2020715 RepID=A0A5R9INR3_9GAMM|nr:sugar phosphate isomerase/epimerase [Thalassotalea litorea]TLU65717.1 sugar phosphate isomerase/epimerase [Thalassotalea litorea]